MTLKNQINHALDYSAKTHTEDCLDANDDTSVFHGKCICQEMMNPTDRPLQKTLSEAHFSKEDIRFVVRAVNSHETLLEAARYAVCSETCQHNKCQGLRDAIAQAEGK
jgi:hypothetical protein